MIYPEAANLEAPTIYHLEPGRRLDQEFIFTSRPTPAYVLAQILEMVSSVYRPFGDDEIRSDLNPSDFERYHKEFIALHCQWDPSRQMYVREDGSFFTDRMDNSVQHHYQFTNNPQLDVSVTFGRTRHNQVEYSLSTNALGMAKMGDAILSFQDVSAGKEVAWVTVNEQIVAPPQEAEYLALPAHLPTKKNWMVTSGFTLRRGNRIRLKLEIDGKSYFSSVFRP